MKARTLSASAFGLAVFAAASYPAFAQDIIVEDGVANAPCSTGFQNNGPCNNNPQPKEIQGPNSPSNGAGMNSPTTTGSVSNTSGIMPDAPAVTTGNGTAGNGSGRNGLGGRGGARSAGNGGMGGGSN
jgi:hypothetical protein